MRIISGTHKGRPIYLPKVFKARPTTDFAKESLFNIINNHFDFQGLKVLDLFSGTGSISYEFASRGAGEVDSVEKDFKNYDFIRKNVKTLGLNVINVFRTDVFVFLKHGGKKYSIIFADPPYELKGIEGIPALIREKKIVESFGWFILEHSEHYNFSKEVDFIEQRVYGSVNFTIFKGVE